MLKWLSFSGVAKEAKRVRWPKANELFKSCFEVVVFCLLFGAFFVIAESVIVYLLKFIGLGA